MIFCNNVYAFSIIDNVLRCVLGLYASDIDLPLPTPEEVLLCTSTTTAEEVSHTST